MIEELAPAFIGPFAWFASSVVTTDDPRPRIRARELIEGRTLSDILGAHKSAYPEVHISAFAAMWARLYNAKVIPATIGASLFMGLRLPVALDDVEIILDQDGVRPVAAVLANLGEPEHGQNAFDRFHTLVFGHLDMVFDALAGHGRVKRKILWGDAALSFEYFLHRAAALEQRPLDGLGFDPFVLLNSRQWTDGRPNPLYEPTISVETPEGPQKRRKTCCLTYRLGGERTFCVGCPVGTKRQRRATCAKEAA